MSFLSDTFNRIQKWLLPSLEEEIGELTGKQSEFVRIVELISPQQYFRSFHWKGFGRPPELRVSIFKDFVAKSVYNFPTTKLLILENSVEFQ